MTNHLIRSSSPYLLQHAHNPVDWYPWGDEALNRAKIEDKPIFLSIGYAACHWCHVMAHESFEDAEIADFLNQHFIPIKVDREERPDLDGLYLNAVVALTGQGGWPLSVFLSPDGKPFYGGTYFPPVPRYNMPSFRQVINQLVEIWSHDREKITQVSEQLTAQINQQMHWSIAPTPVSGEIVAKACQALVDSYDWTNGGWGGAPKFPQPMIIEFLLRQAAQGNNQALKVYTHALNAMSQGGMLDLVGGGFHRYSTDERWHIPHYEKMLYDNAQLALVYLHGSMLMKNEEWKDICTSTLDFILREMTGPEGGFYSSLDADSDGEEGAYYTWNIEEISNILELPEEATFFFDAHGLNPQTSHGVPITLQRNLNIDELASQYKFSPAIARQKLSECYQRLYRFRQGRVRPSVDDKVLAAWNGLALRVLTEAASVLKRPDYLEVAQKNAGFILDHLLPEGNLLRNWRQNVTGVPGYLEDYASLILGLLSLYQSDQDTRWFIAARDLLNQMTNKFKDKDGGFFDAEADHQGLLFRTRELQDNATPSGNALAVEALIRMAAFTGETGLVAEVENLLGTIQDVASRYPHAVGYWLSDLDLYLRPVRQVAILQNPKGPVNDTLLNIYWHKYRPQTILAVSPYPPPSGSPELLRDRPLVSGQTTVYICEGFQCKLPVTTIEQFERQLDDNQSS